MDVLIIGGTGLISTAITRQLAATDHDVTCFTRGERSVSLPTGVGHVTGDRHDPAALRSVRDQVTPDCVIDMVCYTPDTAREAITVFAGAIEQYIFTSTVDVYHRPPRTQPITEDFARTPNVSDYGREKAACEDLYLESDDDGAFAATIIRPWSTYGEGGPVLHTLGTDTAYLDRLRAGKPIVQHGDGQGLWGPCHREDVARAYVTAVGDQTTYGETYHVTSEEVITWRQYHSIVADALGAPEPTLVCIPTEQLRAIAPERTQMLRDHFRFSTVFDNTKAKRELDFAYTISFREGVERVIAWLDRNARIDPWDTVEDDRIIAAWKEATDSFVTELSPGE